MTFVVVLATGCGMFIGGGAGIGQNRECASASASSVARTTLQSLQAADSTGDVAAFSVRSGAATFLTPSAVPGCEEVRLLGAWLTSIFHAPGCLSMPVDPGTPAVCAVCIPVAHNVGRMGD